MRIPLGPFYLGDKTLSEGSMQIRYTSMFLLRYYEEIPKEPAMHQMRKFTICGTLRVSSITRSSLSLWPPPA